MDAVKSYTQIVEEDTNNMEVLASTLRHVLVRRYLFAKQCEDTRTDETTAINTLLSLVNLRTLNAFESKKYPRDKVIDLLDICGL